MSVFGYFKEKKKERTLVPWEIKYLHEHYPRSARFMYSYATEVYVSLTPFADCQTFSIGAINTLTRSQLVKEEIADLLYKIIEFTAKTQFVIDIRQDQQKEILNLLKPFIKGDVKALPFISTNSSEMVLILIKLDESKIIKTNKSK